MSTSTTPATLFKDKLRQELDRQAMSISALARRFEPDDTSKEFDSARRLIHKHLSGKVVPNRSTRRRYERILDLQTGELEPDDEEASSMRLPSREQVLDTLLDVLQHLKSNATATPLAGSAAVASTQEG